MGITVSWKCIWEFFPLQSILWTKLRHLLWVQEFAGFCCINLIKLWTIFPIVSYSVCFCVRVGQKEEFESRIQSTRLESRSKAKLLFSEIFVVRHGQMKKCLVGFDSPSFYTQPVFSTVGSTSHPHVCLQWNTAATSMLHFLSCPFTVPLQLNVLTLQISLQAHLFSHSGLSGWPVRDSSSILPCRPLLPSPPTTVHSLVPAKEISYLVNSKWPYYLTDKVNIESLWHFQGQAIFKTPGKSCYMLYSTIF